MCSLFSKLVARTVTYGKQFLDDPVSRVPKSNVIFSFPFLPTH